MYCLAEIDEGGFIYTSFHRGGMSHCRRMVHKETIFPFDGQVLIPTLQDAKKILPGEPEFGYPEFILAIGKNGAVERLWCFEAHEELIRKRLKTWSGCYGAWPIRRLNAPVPLSR